MSSQALGYLMNSRRVESRNELKTPNSKYFKLAACDFWSTFDFLFSPSPVAELCGDDRRIWIVKYPNTGFKMALCINDSQNKFAQFTSEKLRGFMSASSPNSPWAVKVKFVLFPSHTSSSSSSSVIWIMRAKLCLSYTYENSNVFLGVRQM